MENAITLLTGILNDNPSFIIQISGNAGFDEANPKRIAKKRANFIRKKLIAKGIS